MMITLLSNSLLGTFSTPGGTEVAVHTLRHMMAAARYKWK